MKKIVSLHKKMKKKTAKNYGIFDIEVHATKNIVSLWNRNVNTCHTVQNICSIKI